MINSLKLIFLDSFCKKVVNVFQAKSPGVRTRTAGPPRLKSEVCPKGMELFLRGEVG